MTSTQYGGFFAPGTLAHFQRQNEALLAGKLNKTQYHHLELDTLGLLNGCVDMTFHLPSYPEMANNNTYGVQILPQDVYESAKANLTKKGGCLEQVEQCRQLGNEGDAEYLGLNETVNEMCGGAILDCVTNVESALMSVAGVSKTLRLIPSHLSCSLPYACVLGRCRFLTEVENNTEKLLRCVSPTGGPRAGHVRSWLPQPRVGSARPWSRRQFQLGSQSGHECFHRDW